MYRERISVSKWDQHPQEYLEGEEPPKKLRSRGQRSRGKLTMKCFGSQGKRTFKKERMVSRV